MGRHCVEPPGVGFRRQRLDELGRDRFVDPQQVLDRVRVLEPSEPAQRGPLLAAGQTIRVDQRALQRPERRLDRGRVWLRRGGGRHLACRQPLVDLLPRAVRLVIGEIEPEPREIERRGRPVAVAPEAGGLHERGDGRLERLGGGDTGRHPERHKQDRTLADHC